MDTSNSSFNFDGKHAGMLAGAIAGMVAVAFALPKLVALVAPLSVWGAMFLDTANSLGLAGSFISTNEVIGLRANSDFGSILSAIAICAYPMHLAFRYLLKGLGKQPEKLAVFGPTATKWLALISAFAAVSSLSMGIGSTVFLAGHTVGDFNAEGPAGLVILLDLLLVPSCLIMAIVYGVASLRDVGSGRFAQVDALGDHPLIAYPASMLLSVASLVFVLKLVFKWVIRIARPIVSVALRIFGIFVRVAAFFIDMFLTLLSIFARLM